MVGWRERGTDSGEIIYMPVARRLANAHVNGPPANAPPGSISFTASSNR